MGVAQNMIEKSGAWYSYQGTRIGQGKDNVREYLKENKNVAKDIETKLRALLLANPDAITSKMQAEVEEGEAVDA